MRSSTVSTKSPSCPHGAVPPCPVPPQLRRLDTARRLQVLICLAFLASLTTASAQLAPTRPAPRGEPLEIYDNPPAPPRKIETSPRMISVYGVFTSYQANVDQNGQNILGDAAHESA